MVRVNAGKMVFGAVEMSEATPSVARGKCPLTENLAVNRAERSRGLED